MVIPMSSPTAPLSMDVAMDCGIPNATYGTNAAVLPEPNTHFE